MKKILFALVTVVALMCSVTNKASAAEETTETEEETTSDVYGGNLFTGLEINFVWDENFNHYFTYENPNYTSLIHVKEEKQIALSIKLKKSDHNIDISRGQVIKLTGNVLLFDSNFSIIYSKSTSNMNCWSSFKYDETGEYVILNWLFEDKIYSYDNVGLANYISFDLTKIDYLDSSGTLHTAEEIVSADFYIGYITKGSVEYEDFETLEFDYNLKDQPQITWNYDDKYLELNVNESIFNNPAAIFTATDKDGNSLSISYGDIGRFKMPGEVGNYYYIFEAKNQYGDRDYKYVIFNVIDDIAPTVYGPTILTVPNKVLTSITAIKNSLIISDNQDSPEDINVVLKYDYYSDNYNVPGEYYICFTAIDKSGNSTDYIIKIIVEDKNAPLFYDSNGIAKYETKVLKSLDSVLLLSDITSQLKALDNIDGELKISLHKDEYTGNGDIVGTYKVVLKAQDKSGNISYHNVEISVVDTMPSKVIFLDNKIVIVEKNVKLSASDFHSILKLCGKYNLDTTSYTKVQTYIYEPSYSVPGEYLVPYEITTTSGVEESDTLIVKVVESRTNGSFIDRPEQVKEDGVIVSILKWIWNLIVSLYNWFIGLFK